MSPILGFMPDAEQTMPGVLSDCDNLVPCQKGMCGAPEPVTPSGVGALAAECRGAAVISQLSGTRRTFAGTDAAIYEFTAGAWADVSRVGGYNGTSSNRWSITQFGDTTIMSNFADEMQYSNSGAFADISGAPKAEIVFSVGSFVMALNVNDGAVKPDGWHCCAAFDATDWAESVTTQSASGRLVATSGYLTAGAGLGTYAIAYKEKSIYIGRYVGAPSIWEWDLVQGGEAGCVGKEAICDINGAHFFVGPDNFWVYDGVSVTSVGDGKVRDWFQTQVNPEFAYRTICSFNKATNCVWVFYPSAGSETPDATLVFHTKTGKWGRANREIQAALNYVTPGYTIDGLDAVSATIDGLPDIGFDSPFWNAGTYAMSVFNTYNQLQTLTGESTHSSLTTGDVGDDDQVTLLQQIRLRYAMAPTSASVQTYSMMNSGGAYTSGAAGAMNDGKFDVLKSARWHQARVSFSGAVEVTHMNAKFKASGKR